MISDANSRFSASGSRSNEFNSSSTDLVNSFNSGANYSLSALRSPEFTCSPEYFADRAAGRRRRFDNGYGSMILLDNDFDTLLNLCQNSAHIAGKLSFRNANSTHDPIITCRVSLRHPSPRAVGTTVRHAVAPCQQLRFDDWPFVRYGNMAAIPHIILISLLRVIIREEVNHDESHH